MKKAAIYLRTSTSRQETGLEAQRRAIENHLRSKGVHHWEIYQDEGISGAKASRPALDQLLSDVNDQKVFAVYVYSFSRFARSTKHLLAALEEFRTSGVEFVSISENIDTATSMGRLVFSFIAALAQFERELISERVKNGLENARAKGKRIGRPKERPSSVIRELLLKGCTYREIARIIGCSHWSISQEVKEMRSENNWKE